MARTETNFTTPIEYYLLTLFLVKDFSAGFLTDFAMHILHKTDNFFLCLLGELGPINSFSYGKCAKPCSVFSVTSFVYGNEVHVILEVINYLETIIYKSAVRGGEKQ